MSRGRKKDFSPFSIFLVVFLSGCTLLGISQPGGITAGSQGVIISKFTTIGTSFEPNTPILLDLAVKNVGGQTARQVSVELFGLPQDVAVSPSRIQAVGDMTPSIRGSEGLELPLRWTVTAPEKSVQIPYKVVAKATYQYSTEFDGQIRVVSPEEVRISGRRGGVTFQQSTAGPISIRLRDVPVSISGGRIPLIFEFTNTGGGRIFTGFLPTPETSDRLFVTVSGVTFCPRNEVLFTTSGRTGSLVCFIDLPSVFNFQEFSIKVTTSYFYQVEKETAFTVLPRVPI